MPQKPAAIIYFFTEKLFVPYRSNITLANWYPLLFEGEGLYKSLFSYLIFKVIIFFSCSPIETGKFCLTYFCASKIITIY